MAPRRPLPFVQAGPGERWGGQTSAPLLGRSQSYRRALSAAIPGGFPALAHGFPTPIPLTGHDRERTHFSSMVGA